MSTNAPDGRLDRDLVVKAVVLVLGGLAPQLDTTVVNVGLHSIARGLGSPVATVQWVATAYLLALGVAIPLSAWATRRWGGRATWLAGLALFLAASVVAGASTSAGMLIAVRVVQGATAGILTPLLLTLLLQAAGDRPLGHLMTLVTLFAVAVPIAGPVIGGGVVHTLNWRWLFFINVPITIAAIAGAWWRLRDTGPRRPQPLDALGLALLSPGLAAILFGLSAASGAVSGQIGFGQPVVVAPLAAGLLLSAAFAVHATRRGERALVDLRVFRRRSFAVGSVLLGLSGLSLYGALLLLPLYEQTVRGGDALTAGLLLVPQGVGALLVRPLGPLVDRVGARPVVIGGTLLAILGTVPFALAGGDTTQWLLSAALVVRGAGLSATNIAMLSVSLQGLAPEERPHAGTATRILQYVGGSFGTAVLATILAGQLAIGDTVHAFDIAFWWAVAFAAAGIVPALLLPAHRRARREAGTLRRPGEREL